MKKTLIFLTIAIFTSCGVIVNNTPQSDISSAQTYLSVEIFQTLSNTEALAHTSNYKVVKLETGTEIYYDGKKINGDFKLTGTYTYTTKDENIKTVPVYTRTSPKQGELGQKKYLSVEIIQTLSKNEALAFTKDYKTVKIETVTDIYYDGKKISGDFCLAGTYTYTTKNGTVKTVPVYIRESEYRQLMK